MVKRRAKQDNVFASWKTSPPTKEKRAPKPGWRPEVGERVRLLALGKAADVLAISEDGLQLTVRCGVMRTTVELNAFESLDGRKADPPPVPVVKVQARSGLGGGAQVRTSRNTLDIRGMRVTKQNPPWKSSSAMPMVPCG